MKQFVGVALLIAALCPSFWLAWQSRDMPHLGAAHDDAIYWICAKSLAENSSYRTLSSPGSPFQTLYPPLYPALLSVVWRLDPSFPRNLRIAALLNWSLLPLFVALCVIYFRETGLGWGAWPLGAFTAVLPVVVLSGLRLMSELLFSVLLLSAVIALDRAAKTRSARWLVTAGLLAGLACLAKTAGIAWVLAGAFALAVVHREMKRAAIFLAVSAPFILGWIWWVKTRPAPALSGTAGSLSNYSEFLFRRVGFGEHLALAAKNCSLLGQAIAGLFIPTTAWRAGLVDLAIVAGVILLFRHRRSRTYAIFGLTYIAVLIAWPYPPDVRLAMPLLPLLAASLGAAVGAAWSFLVTERKRVAVTVCTASCLSLAAVGLAISLIASYAMLRQGFPQFVEQQRRQRACDQSAYDWVRTNTRPSDKFLADQAPVLYLYTGRTALTPILPATDWYQTDEYRVEDWLRILPEFIRNHGLAYAVVCESDFSATSKAKAVETFRAEGWTRRTSSCEDCAIYEIAGPR